VLMNQSSRDDTVDGVRPPRPPARDAVSPQSSRDKRSKRSLTATSPTEGKPISGVFGASEATQRVIQTIIRPSSPGEVMASGSIRSRR